MHVALHTSLAGRYAALPPAFDGKPWRSCVRNPELNKPQASSLHPIAVAPDVSIGR